MHVLSLKHSNQQPVNRPHLTEYICIDSEHLSLDVSVCVCLWFPRNVLSKPFDFYGWIKISVRMHTSTLGFSYTEWKYNFSVAIFGHFHTGFNNIYIFTPDARRYDALRILYFDQFCNDYALSWQQHLYTAIRNTIVIQIPTSHIITSVD